MLGGANLSDYITKQLSVLPPVAYASKDLKQIAPRVLELVYTSFNMRPFAADVWRDCHQELKDLIRRQWEDNKQMTGGHELSPAVLAEIAEEGIPLAPFKWDEERRTQIRAELDAYYAVLYGLTRDELRYILDPKDLYGPDFPSESFRVLKEREEKQFGEYRTGRLVLEAYDKLLGGEHAAMGATGSLRVHNGQ
jgi:hypothetical protein